jgi:flagellin
MALTVYQNLYAFTSQKNLAVNQLALGKSIERLSSGLRINHAADDASGMAISEKMRGQISGMKRASMNAQDGISYLQTAEGAMEQTGSILQRMRELAVQASNGIYTSNDRLEIQKEIDQLKEEIDRVSSSTEFNTRKLTNGEGIGLWSSSTKLIDAIMRAPVAEGNYEITMEVTPGRNQIQKTNIFTLNEGALGAEVNSAMGTNISSVSDPVSLTPTKDEDLIVEVRGLSVNNDSTSTAYGTMTAAISSSVEISGRHAATNSDWVVTAQARTIDSATGTASTTSTAGITSSGYVEIEFLSDSNGQNSTNTRMRFIDAKTGDVGAWQEMMMASAGGTTSAMGTFGAFTIKLSSASSTINRGDKMLLAITADPNELSPMPIQAGVLSAGGGIIKMGHGPYVVYGQDEITRADNSDPFLDESPTVVHYVDMDEETGNINFGHVTMNFKENGSPQTAGLTVTGSFTLSIRGGGEAATSTTKLQDIRNFTNADGNMVLSPKKELTVYGNGNKTVVHLEGNDTIATFVGKLQKAIVEDLDMGADDPQVNKNLVQYVTVPNVTNNAWDAVKGTMLIQSAIAGTQGELAFIGDQGLLNGLGLAEVQKAVNNTSEVTIRDAHTGNFIGKEVTGNDRIYSIIDGVELVIDSRAGVDVKWNYDGGKNEILFDTNEGLAAKKHYMHIVDNRTSLQIGANKGQDLNVSIPQLDLKGLGLEDLTMVTQFLAQDAIGLIDDALTKVVSARATVGAQISRLEYTIQNLATARENLAMSESRIRDLDVAEESTNFANNQVLVQSGVAMLAQANQIPSYALQLIQG